MKQISAAVHGVRPWKSPDAGDGLRCAMYDSMEQVEYCMHHCPYTECINCCGGVKQSGRGRPPLIPDDAFERLAELMTRELDDSMICIALGIDQELLKKCKRKVRRACR